MFSLVRIFHFLKIYLRNKINWTHIVLDYSCNIAFAVRICLYITVLISVALVLICNGVLAYSWPQIALNECAVL